MKKKIFRPGFTILLFTLSFFGCGVKEFRSPIVFRSPVVFGEPNPEKPPQEAAASLPPSETVAAQPLPTPLPSPSPEPEKTVSRPATAVESTPVVVTAPPSEAEPAITSPVSIPIVSEEDLKAARYSPLGRVKVSSPPGQPFSQEKALQKLKIEAFKRHGNLAQGITGIEYKKAGEFLSSGGGMYKEVSGEVVMLAKKEGAEPGEIKTLSPGTEYSTERSFSKEAEEVSPIDQIKILTSDVLLHRNFRVLGKVSVRDKSPTGLTYEQALKALKTEAYREYGPQANGLTNVILTRKEGVFYYTKVRRDIATPKKSQNYQQATSEVITWVSNN